jgi:DNA-binding NarL/FixJ family response regulator
MKAHPPIRILLVDDHYVVRMGLAAVLKFERDLKIVATADDGDQAVKLFRQHQPDITLMDARMPVVDGIQALRQIRAEFTAARIIMLTTYEDEEDVYRALQAGAQGYILKKASQGELVAAIHQVHAGGRSIPAAMAQSFETRAAQADLTPRQVEVLELLAKGMSNKDIARLLGFTEDGAKAHMRNIFAKLGVSDRTEAVAVAIQRGVVRLS